MQFEEIIGIVAVLRHHCMCCLA